MNGLLPELNRSFTVLSLVVRATRRQDPDGPYPATRSRNDAYSFTHRSRVHRSVHFLQRLCADQTTARSEAHFSKRSSSAAAAD